MADHVGTYEITGDVMATATNIVPLELFPPVITGALPGSQNSLPVFSQTAERTLSMSSYARNISNDAIPLASSSGWGFDDWIGEFSSSQPEVTRLNAFFSGTESIDSRVSQNLYYSKDRRLQYVLVKRIATLSDLFLVPPETAPSASALLTASDPFAGPLLTVSMSQVGLTLGTPDPSGSLTVGFWNTYIHSSTLASGVIPPQLVSASVGNVVYVGSNWAVVVNATSTVTGASPQFVFNIAPDGVGGFLTSSGFSWPPSINNSVKLLSWAPLSSSLSGVYLNNTVYAPRTVSVPVTSSGRLRDLRCWVELLHDDRTPQSTSTVDHGLQGLAIAVRSPNSAFRTAQPLWNQPQVVDFPIDNAPDVLATTGAFGSKFSGVPALLQDSYLLWEGHGTAKALRSALSDFVISASYHEFDQDIDMKTVFWDGSSVNNPREIQSLYPSASDNSPGTPLPYVTLTTTLGMNNYQSPTSGALRDGLGAFYTPPVVLGHAPLTCTNTPWMLDFDLPLGALEPNKALLPALNPAPPPGWLTAGNGLLPWIQLTDDDDTRLGSMGKSFVRPQSRRTYSMGGGVFVETVGEDNVTTYSEDIWISDAWTANPVAGIFQIATPLIQSAGFMPGPYIRFGLCHFDVATGSAATASFSVERVLLIGGAEQTDPGEVGSPNFDANLVVSVGYWSSGSNDITWDQSPISFPVGIMDPCVFVRSGTAFVCPGTHFTDAGLTTFAPATGTWTSPIDQTSGKTGAWTFHQFPVTNVVTDTTVLEVGNVAAMSSDGGSSYHTITSSFANTLISLASGNTTGQWVAVDGVGGRAYFTSDTGSTWTSGALGGGFIANAITSGANNFAAVGTALMTGTLGTTPFHLSYQLSPATASILTDPGAVVSTTSTASTASISLQFALASGSSPSGSLVRVISTYVNTDANASHGRFFIWTLSYVSHLSAPFTTVQFASGGFNVGAGFGDHPSSPGGAEVIPFTPIPAAAGTSPILCVQIELLTAPGAWSGTASAGVVQLECLLPDAVMYGVATNGVGDYVAVGHSTGVVGSFLSTNQGSTWTPHRMGNDSENFRAVAFGFDQYVAVGDNGSTMQSINGLSWSRLTGLVASYQSIIFSQRLFMYVAVGTNTCATYVFGFPSSWVVRSIPAGAYTSVTEVGLFLVAIGPNAAAHSFDGINWTIGTNPGSFQAAGGFSITTIQGAGSPVFTFQDSLLDTTGTLRNFAWTTFLSGSNFTPNTLCYELGTTGNYTSSTIVHDVGVHEFDLATSLDASGSPSAFPTVVDAEHRVWSIGSPNGRAQFSAITWDSASNRPSMTVAQKTGFNAPVSGGIRLGGTGSFLDSSVSSMAIGSVVLAAGPSGPGGSLSPQVAATALFGPTAGPGEFYSLSHQLGPSNIRPVYPILDDSYVLKEVADPNSVGAFKLGSSNVKTVGVRPGLRRSEFSGTWQFLFGTAANNTVISSSGYTANPRAGVWFRQVRLEAIVDVGEPVASFIPSQIRRFTRPANVGPEGFKRIAVESGSCTWDVGLNYVQSFQPPEYGRSVGITGDANALLDSFAVQTFLTGALVAQLSASGVANPTDPAFFLGGNQFGTPFVPDSSRSLGTGSAELVDASASAEIFRQTVGIQTIVPNANDLVSFLNRQGFTKTTLQRWEETDALLASGTSSGFFPGI